LVAKISNYNNYAISYDYDNLGRKIKETQVIGGSAFIQQYTFDSLGRAKQTTYPSGLSIVNEYNNYGFLYRIKNSSSNKIYWQINELTALEQITKQLYGNGLTVNREFDKNTNFLTSINTQNGKGNQQNLGFNYDVIGNLTERKDLLQNKQEIFEYDALNRLLKAKIAGADSLSMLYDELGNITYKSDVGNYHYGSVNNGPHQLNSIDLTTKQCIPGLQINTEYYSFNKVKSVSKDSNLIEVYYNNGRQRILQKKYVGNKLVRTKIYVSPIFEKEITNTDTTEIHYIKGAEGTIAVFETKKKNNKVAAFLTYLHRDHIGSVVMLTSDSGYILANYSYDAWGKRRNSNWTNSIPDTTLLKNERGFTGHEHYDLFELIDMNGRIYDPTLGCFLSPDPFIQDPSNLQNLNRYCYVVNNPLSLVDPSGHFFGAFSLSKIGGFISNWGSIFRTIGGVISEIGKFQEHVASVAGQWVKENYKTIIVAAIAITASVLTAGALAGCSYLLIATVSGAAAGFASGVSATLINGGNLKDALLAGGRGAIIGAATSAATFGVGRLAETAGSSMGSVGSFGVKVIGHGAVQGASNVVQGGKFSHGFFSGAVSGAVSPTVAEKFDSKIAQIAVASVAGGTTSAICGGKFANGAVTGAFVMMYSSSLKDAITEKDPITKALENWKPDPKESITLASNVDIPTSMARGAVWGAAISGLAMEVGVITVTAATPVGWIIIGSAAVGAGINLYRSNMDFTSKTLESIDKAMKP
jgi:RHS repeat-associated protein